MEEGIDQSKKDALIARIRAMFPDVEEDVMYDNFMQFMDDMISASNAHKSLNEKLEQHPKAAMMLADMHDGVHPAIAIKRHFGEELEIEEGSEDYDKLLNAERERLADEQASAEMKAEYENNLLESQEAVRQFKESKGLDDEKFQEFMESAVELTRDLLSGKLNITLLEILWKGRNYDTDMANETQIAEQRGMIAGRNEKIEMDKRKKLGDGLPVLTTSAVKEGPTFTPRQSAWDKGRNKQ